jgi:hypothetical protein
VTPTSTASTSGGGCGGIDPATLVFVTTTDPQPAADGTVDLAHCQAACPATVPSQGNTTLNTCTATRDSACPSRGWDVTCTYLSWCTGRRPEGFSPAEQAAHGALEAFLCQSAQLEHASIAAFDRLARELAFHGAPAALIERARRAQADEVRHAAAMQALLSRPTPLQVGGTLPVRPLFEVALENAVEGCVRETYGAAQARWQVERAAWPALRAAMEAIAEEELSHAELAFEIAAWLDARLTPQEQARLAMARAQEIAHLREALSVEAAAAVRDAVGLPSAAQALALHARLQADLWA